MYNRQGSEAYAQVALKSHLAAASPTQLISMLFDGAHNAIQCAVIYGEKGNIAMRGKMISKAINIIDNGLRASLDHEKGQQVAVDLERLYDYMSRTLLIANKDCDIALLMHVDELLMRLATTWEEITADQYGGQHG